MNKSLLYKLIVYLLAAVVLAGLVYFFVFGGSDSNSSSLSPLKSIYGY